MKIVLGAAQIGMNYGLFNNKKISKSQFKKIEKKIFSSGYIKYIDTANTYGKSEKIIGSSKLKNLKIITKVSLPKKKIKDVEIFIGKKIKKTLNNLNKKKIYGILFHNSNDLLKSEGKLLLKYLLVLKKKKIIKKIGISIYSPLELNKIWKFWKPDIVQAPLNILDNRIINSGWINILVKNKVKIFARSCFLKGLLLSDYNKLKISKSSKFLLNKFNNWCLANNISKVKACLDFVRQFTKIEFVVLGFNNYNQLLEVINIFKEKRKKIPRKFSSNNLSLIDPRKWNC